MKKLFLIGVLALSACVSSDRQPSSAYVDPRIQLPINQEPDYPRTFKVARDLLGRPGNKKIALGNKELRLDEVSETQLVSVLLEKPIEVSRLELEGIKPENLNVEAWREVVQVDPLKHLRLVPPEGQDGYSDLKVYVNHPYYRKMNDQNKVIAASNLEKVWIEFIKQAKKEIILNVFDFDLMSVARELVRQARQGKVVIVGVDAGVVQHREEVKKVVEYLRRGGVQVTEVNSVGLNHQKMTVLDWSDKNEARVLLSSGNLTQSCLGRSGDLKGKGVRHPYSIPNANHMITLKSFLLANLIKHELSKTILNEYLYRGREYPLSGSYQITGPGVNPQTFEAYPKPSVVVAFSPKGGNKNINKTLIAKAIEITKGPLYMMQFAFSSEEVGEAILRRGEKEIQETGKFQFYSVGDTPFAMQGWSQFLKMSGLKLVKSSDGKKEFLEDEQGPWMQRLGSEELHKLRQNILIAPPEYANHKLKIKDKEFDVSAKIHHKVLASQEFSIMGTSFNFSSGAENNNEQILFWRDPEVTEVAIGMVQYMVDRSRKQNEKVKRNATVYGEAMRRNRFRVFEDEKPAELPKQEVEASSAAP